MNGNSDAREGAFRRGDNPADEHSANHHQKPSPNSTNGFHANGHRPQPKIDFWVVVDALAHRWHWLAIGAIVFGAGFFELGSWYIRPKFTASAQLLRDDTSSEFFKQTPMTPETFAGLLRSPELLRRVGAQADPPIPPEKLTKLIKIEPEPDSDLVKVQLAASDPNEAVDLLNFFSKEAVAFTKEFQKSQAAKLANEYLKKQVSQMDSDIKVLQEQFRGITTSSQTNLPAQPGGNSATAQPAVVMNPSQLMALQKQRERLDALFTQLNDLLAKYTEKHPSVQATREQIEDLQKQLAKLPPGITNSPNLAAQVANSLSRPADAANPESQIFQIRLLSLEEAHAQLKARQREAELYATNPPGLAHVFAEASMKTVQASMRGVKIGVVSFFGGVVGLGATLSLLLLIELVDRRLRTTEDLVRVTKLPLLTTLGDLERMETSERTQWAFRAWTMLQGRLSPSANHGLVCGITSSEQGEGRSTWIKLLAEAASMTGFRVLTIATRPSPTHFASDENTTGLLSERQMSEPSDANGHSTEANGFNHSNHSPNGNGSQALATNVLTSPAKVTEQLTGPNSQPVVHIPLPGWVWNLERRKQWREALNHWRKIDNLVILVELPPACVPEAVLLGSNLPNLVWLSDSGKADAGETRVQLNTLRDARCNLVGAVLNREQAVPLRKRFPRWIGCAMIASAFASAAMAQDTPLAQDQSGGTKASPVEVAVRQPVYRGPSFSELPEEGPEPALALQTNLAFSVVNPSQRAVWQQHLTLGPGDVLNLGLYGAPELARAEVSIGPDGRISYLEAQDVRADGLTIDELRAALDKDLANYRRAPRTMLTLAAFRSKRYYILGKVMTKGVYTLDRPMTVLEAIARAHGLENGLVDRNVVDLADFQKSFLARGGKRYPLNFEKLFQDGDLSQNIPIEPGDYIYFPSTDVKEVYVVGEVRLPGAVTYNPDITIMAAITERGGYSERAYKSKVLVVRGSLNNPQTFAVNTHAILDGKEVNFKLQPRDIIYVNSRPFIKVEELADLAVTAFIQSLITSWVGIDIVRPFSQNPIFK
jgi:protein involved in polysaccharide export with SLBB domain/capsular polysaccharide biosynthesis protein